MKLSIVIPVFNEEGNIACLYRSLCMTMNSLGEEYEIIFVNDGSSDGGIKILKGITDGRVTVIDLSAHSGKSLAMQAGFDIARGDILVTLDGDMQDDPREIPKLLDKINEGFDVVCGWRISRKDGFLKKSASFIANAIRRVIFGEAIHDAGCNLKAFRREVLSRLRLDRDMHVFFPTLAVKLGFRVGEVRVRHYCRKSGQSKYNIAGRAVKGSVNLMRVYFNDTRVLMRRCRRAGVKEVFRNNKA